MLLSVAGEVGHEGAIGEPATNLTQET